MFFGEDRINWVRQMVLSVPDVKNLKAKIVGIEKELARATNNNVAILKKELAEAKKELEKPLSLYLSAIKKLLPMQRRDFEQIFTTMDGLPVTIRLLDPPLHEFFAAGRIQSKRNGKTNEDQP